MNVTGCGIMSSVWGMILQWGSTIKVNIELHVATRHCHDMTEKLLKATLHQNNQPTICPLSLEVCLVNCLVIFHIIEPPHDKTNKMACVRSEDSDQPGILPSLIVFTVRMKKAWVLRYPGWSESLLGAQSLFRFCHEAAHMLLYLMHTLSDLDLLCLTRPNIKLSTSRENLSLRVCDLVWLKPACSDSVGS